MRDQALAGRLFTVECHRIFHRAEELAGELGHSAVDTDHLLLGMLEVPSFGAAALEGAGAPAEVVRAEVAGRTHRLSDDELLALLGIHLADVRGRLRGAFGEGPPQALPWTDLARQVLVDASDLATDDAIASGMPPELHITGTDWLFLALLEREEGVAADVIAILGVDRVEVQHEIASWQPIVHRFRQRMLADPTHGQYRRALHAPGLTDEGREAVRPILDRLHLAHDQLIATAARALREPDADEEAVAVVYFQQLAAPVEAAELDLAAAGVSLN